MLIEEWVKWEPLEGAAAKYCFDNVIDDNDNFFLVLFDETNPKKKILLDFTKSPAYFQQKIELKLRAKTLAMLMSQHGEAFAKEWTFFKIINSKQIEWMSAQAGVVYNFNKFQHFIFITTNYVIDIVAPRDPIVKIITKDSIC